ncbi:unnamed protein product [Mucor hiemalis]
MLVLSIYFCICFSLIIKESFAFFASSTTTLNKRQAIASRICGTQNNSVAICSPTSDSIWYNNTYEQVTWKYNNPTFDQFNELDLYLLYQNGTSSTSYQTIKTWPALDKSKGTLVPLIDNSWYPSPIADNSQNVSWTMYFYIVGANYDIQTDLDLIPSAHNFFPAPQPFTLIQNAINTTATTSPSGTSSNNPAASSAVASPSIPITNSSKKLPGWAIAVIVIASLLFLLAIAAMIWAYRRYKNKRQLNGGAANSGLHGDDEKVPVLAPNKNESNIAVAASTAAAIAAGKACFTFCLPRPYLFFFVYLGENNRSGGDISSIHSSTQQLWSPRSLSPKHDEISFVTTSEKPPAPTQAQQLGLHSEANQSSSILSSTDALMIADTFRQFMRKPDWNEELELNEQNKKRILLKKTDELELNDQNNERMMLKKNQE